MKQAFLITMFFVNICYVMSINNEAIKLPKQNKIEHTFSGDLTETKSFHLIFTKHRKTKEFQVFSYLYDGVEITKIGVLNSKYSYSLISFHFNENIFSLLMKYKIKKESFIKRIDINIETSEIVENKPLSHKHFETSIRKANKSILIYKSEKELLIKQYTESEEVQENTINLELNNGELKRFFKDQNISSVNTDEFIANGSTSKLRVYLINNKIVFTKENQEENQTSVVSVSLEDIKDKYVYKKFDNKGEKLKKSTSFLNGKRLYQLAVSKNSGYIKIWDIDSKEELNHITLNEGLSFLLKDTHLFVGITNYLKQSSKNKYIPTITINKTENELLRLRVDYVDITYSYGYDWWWHHQQFMMHMQMQQQQMMNSVPNFGPSFLGNDFHFNNYSISKINRHFVLLIDQDSKVSNNVLPKTVYKNVNKEIYIDRVEDVSDYKHVSSCFLKESFRYIVYSKRLKSFVIKTDKLE